MVRHMKNHFFEVAALTVVVRSVVDDLAGRDRPLKGLVREALALVERFVAGDGVTLTELVAAQAGAQSDDALPLKEREQDRAVRWANTAVGNVAWMAQKGRGWQGGERFVMDAAGYALSSLRTDGVRDHNALEALRKTALAEVSAKPKAPKARRVATKETTPKMPKPVRVRDELLPFLGTMANAHLVKCKALFDPERCGSGRHLGRCARDRARAFVREPGQPPEICRSILKIRTGNWPWEGPEKTNSNIGKAPCYALRVTRVCVASKKLLATVKMRLS